MKASRSDAFDAVSSERDYQDAKWGGPDDRARSVGDHLTLLRAHLAKADLAYATNHGDEEALAEVRNLAALAVRCMESNGISRRGQSGSA